ncbi:tail fiber domain-containing protein [Gracilimonas halophila]|uniref:Tail fiber domain-containing protein n=1 Tax=Gracilimonas halophila TaxID=1834464 RepID=A0ABW5JIM0_9BACT
MMNKILSKLIFTLLAVLFTAEVMAQVPQGFNFQAVARDANGELLVEQTLGVQVTVLSGSETGTAVYTETQTSTTNASGSFQIVIGEGTSQDNFAGIDWSSDNYYVKLEIDPAGGTSYEELGTTRLLSVPYALLAHDVVNGGSIGELTTEFNLNSTEGDTSFIVNATGTSGLAAIRGNSSTDGVNYGMIGTANSTPSNSNTMYGVFGTAPGEGTGTQIGVLGSAVNDNGTGNRRYGLVGQARSQARENIGGYGVGLGPGDGEIIALGGEFASGSFNVGGFNIGLVGFARDNLNGNIGIRGYVYGTEGARENRGVSAEAVTTGTGRNVGVQSLVHSSQSDNMGFQALMIDVGSGNTSANNIGVELDVSNSTSDNNYGIRGYINGSSINSTGMFLDVSGGSNSNIGMIVNAATAAELNGNVYVNGDLNYSGALNNTSDRRLKENIQPLNSGLETIMKLNPTTYNFRGNGEYNGLKLSTGLHYGLIAQEVEKVLPSLVKDNIHTYTEMSIEGQGPNANSETEIKKTMEYKTMNYTELIPVLIKGMQEQQAEIERLKKEIEELRKDK